MSYASNVFNFSGKSIGGGNFAIIGGPCAVESEDQILSIARDLAAYGADFLRGGAFKPRTSPYDFCGLGKNGIELLKFARSETGLPIVTEIISENHLDIFKDVDVIQIGARNMQNFALLRAVATLKKPVILKRGFCSTIKELLMSAEYLLSGGANEVILCERGIRTFETATKNTLDISAIPVLKSKTHLPVIVDPSHASGNSNYIDALCLGAVAAGADGVMIEVHNKPNEALCDGQQAITPKVFSEIVKKITKLKSVL